MVGEIEEVGGAEVGVAPCVARVDARNVDERLDAGRSEVVSVEIERAGPTGEEPGIRDTMYRTVKMMLECVVSNTQCCVGISSFLAQTGTS